MTLTNNVAAKLSVAFVAIAMVFSLVAAPAQAQTAEELQATIDSLMAQIAALNTQIGVVDTASSASVCPYTWTRSLSTGDTGADVMALQQFLNGSADTQVSVSGAGAPGMETSYYGPATAAAVSNFQVKYRTDILSPVGLVNPTGYFGPSTMSKANMLCVAAPVVDDVMDDVVEDDDDDMSEDDDGPVSLSGEASLDKFEVDDADDDTVNENDEDVEIGMFTVEFADGDAEISRLDIALQGGGDETDPWDTFETVSLWVDGEKIAEEDADSRSDYLDDDDGSIRFTGLDLVVMEDEEVEITVASTLQSGMDDGNDGEDWSLFAGTMRYFDADDVASTDGSTGDLEDDWSGPSADFTIEEAGADDELIAKTSSDDPDASTLAVEDDSNSDWYTVFIFDLDTDDSTNDITLNEIVLNVLTTEATTAADAGYDDLVDDVELVIDGTTIDDVTVGGTSASAGTATLTFDVDGDVTIEAGDRVPVELMLRFNSLPATEEGATVKASISSLTISIVDAEGADDLANSQLSGSATGDTHTLRTTGVNISEFSSETDDDNANADTAADSYGVFTLEFDVTAIGSDEIYIPLTDAVWDDGASSTFGVVYQVRDEGGNNYASSSADNISATVDLVSGGEETAGGYLRLDTDETATLELRVTLNPGAADDYDAVLKAINFKVGSEGTPDSTQMAEPASDYDTGSIYINE